MKLILLHFLNQEMQFCENWLQYFYVENMNCLGHQDNVIYLLQAYLLSLVLYKVYVGLYKAP